MYRASSSKNLLWILRLLSACSTSTHILIYSDQAKCPHDVQEKKDLCPIFLRVRHYTPGILQVSKITQASFKGFKHLIFITFYICLSKTLCWSQHVEQLAWKTSQLSSAFMQKCKNLHLAVCIDTYWPVLLLRI